jgi:DNA-binding MarR family transcriptional regulator
MAVVPVEARRTAAIRDLLASASIFSSALDELMAERLDDVAEGRITFAQLKILTLVSHTDLIGVSDVATFLGVSPAAASKTVARLVENELLERSSAPDDRRVQRLSLTAEGRRLLADFDTTTDRMLDDLFGEIDSSRYHRLASALDRLSVVVAEQSDRSDGVCFRCGIYFRDRCLLRNVPGKRICYQHLGDREGVAVT